MEMIMELRMNADGTSRIETTRFRYNYTTDQSLWNGSISVNCFDLAELVEKNGAPNFESIGVKLQVNLTSENGEEKNWLDCPIC